MTETSASVVIVGAGLAGLTCGRELLRRGITVTVVESSDDVGGRVRSDEFAGFVFDRGFQVIFDSYPAVKRQLDLTTLRLRYFEPGAIICLNGRQITLSDPFRDVEPHAILDSVLTTVISPVDKLHTLRLALELRSHSIEQILSGEDEPTSAYLRRRGFSERMIEVFFRPFYGGIFLDRSLTTSAKCFRFDFKMLSEGYACIPARGIGEVSRQLAEPLQEQGCIRTGAAVQTLLSEGERITGVRLTNGEEIYGRAVVVATAAPEAQRLTNIPMPQGFVQTTTVYFAGTQRLYRDSKILLNAAPDALVNNAQLLTNVAPEYAPQGRHLLSAVVLGLPQLSDAQLCVAVVKDLRRMLAGDTVAQRALDTYYPLRVYRIPYAQFAQPSAIHPRLPDNHSNRPGLYFAAEFTEASSQNAAMVSGEKCAEQIAQQIGNL